MGRKDRLLEKARTSPGNLLFEELCALAASVGFVFRNQSGSHRIYKHPASGKMMNFQPEKHDRNKAKRYQIRQLLAFIDQAEEGDV